MSMIFYVNEIWTAKCEVWCRCLLSGVICVYYRLKSSIFVEGDVLMTTGRSRLFVSPTTVDNCCKMKNNDYGLKHSLQFIYRFIFPKIDDQRYLTCLDSFLWSGNMFPQQIGKLFGHNGFTEVITLHLVTGVVL